MHATTRVLTCPGEEDVLDLAREDPDDEEDAWPRGSPRCSAQALLGRAFQSVEDRLHHDKCHAVSQPLLFRIPHCSTSSPAQDAIGSQEASVPTPT